MREPILRYIGCARGKDLAQIKRARKESPGEFQTIKSGSLKGCVRWDRFRPWRPEMLSFGSNNALRFRVVIRITP